MSAATVGIKRKQTSAGEDPRWHHTQQHLVAGRHGYALPAYRELVKQYPGVAQLWFEQGIAAMGLLDFALADKSFQQAQTLAPGDVSLLILLGQQYHRLRRLDRARGCFECAVAADPNSAVARVNLATWQERDGRLADAQESIDAALALHPRDTQALYFKALLWHRQGKSSEAETILRDLIKSDPLDPAIRSSIWHLLAVVLDGQGQYAEAMKWLLEAKAIIRRTANTADFENNYDRLDRQRRELLAGLTTADIQRWRAESPAAAGPQLAFLGGHPRSGTTLLEQILGAHPDILAFDESEAFVQEILNELMPTQSTKALTLKTLNALAPAHRASLVQRYYKSLLREVAGEPKARVLLDKNPSPTTALHIWLRLFPGLKVIIPLRDPRDVIISCLFQNLNLTTVSVNFLSLERAARHYADLSDTWLRLRQLGGFDWAEIRYEDLVENLETESRRITEFLGLPWDAAQMNYREKTDGNFIYAPTYNDVTRPVHKRAIRRWEHYAEALAPIQKQLLPYCQAFAYPS